MKTKTIENIIGDDIDKLSGIKYLSSLWEETGKNLNTIRSSDALYSKYMQVIDPGLYSIEDVESFTNSLNSDQHGIGALISASINKKSIDKKIGSGPIRVNLNPKSPINFLLYKFENGTARVDLAGDNFAYLSKNAYIYVKKVGYNAFCSSEEVYSKVGEADTWFGQYARNSKFNVKSLGNQAFNSAENVKAKVGSAGAAFGDFSKNSHFTVKDIKEPYLSNTSGVTLKN